MLRVIFFMIASTIYSYLLFSKLKPKKSCKKRFDIILLYLYTLTILIINCARSTSYILKMTVIFIYDNRLYTIHQQKKFDLCFTVRTMFIISENQDNFFRVTASSLEYCSRGVKFSEKIPGALNFLQGYFTILRCQPPSN